MIVAFTGHRPGRLQSDAPTKMLNFMTGMKEFHPDFRVISGMAQGWDTLAAKTAVYLSVPFIAAVPWFGHSSNWPQDHREQYLRLLDEAEAVEVICDVQQFKPWVYQKRDEWMVDNSDLLCSAWDGQREGGTWNTIKYAIKQGRQHRMVHVYEAP